MNRLRFDDVIVVERERKDIGEGVNFVGERLSSIAFLHAEPSRRCR